MATAEPVPTGAPDCSTAPPGAAPLERQIRVSRDRVHHDLVRRVRILGDAEVVDVRRRRVVRDQVAGVGRAVAELARDGELVVVQDGADALAVEDRRALRVRQPHEERLVGLRRVVPERR